jgi:hypothetical protein
MTPRSWDGVEGQSMRSHCVLPAVHGGRSGVGDGLWVSNIDIEG